MSLYRQVERQVRYVLEPLAVYERMDQFGQILPPLELVDGRDELRQEGMVQAVDVPGAQREARKPTGRSSSQ